MDIITSALTGALGKVGGQAVQDAYVGLKALLRHKFGEKSDLAEAVTKLEQKPDSEARRGMLAEEVEAIGADKDEEVLTAAKQLQELLKEMQPQASVTQHVSGDGNIFSGTGNVEVKR